jgi:Zn-dependent peptidase ImmA (M78 family)
VTYLAEVQIEAQAAELWRQHSLGPGFDVERLLDELELGLIWENIEDGDGQGSILGQLVASQGLVILNECHLDLLEKDGGRLRRFTLGHEIAHWILHVRGAGPDAVGLLDGDRTMCRDGSAASIERQAEIFSAALLIHRDSLRSAVPTAPWRGWAPVYRLADSFGVNVTPMAIRLEKLGWMHREADGTPASGPGTDPTQGALFS